MNMTCVRLMRHVQDIIYSNIYYFVFNLNTNQSARFSKLIFQSNFHRHCCGSLEQAVFYFPLRFHTWTLDFD